jgi:hypothetical protein
MIIVRLLDRRGVWMTPVEIFEASPDFPEGDYVLADLDKLQANGLVVSRRRARSTLIEYGLPDWIKAPQPAFSAAYFTYLVRRLFRQLIPAT